MNQQALGSIQGGIIQYAAMIEELKRIAAFGPFCGADQLFNRFHHLALIDRFNLEN
jgi:hypothetical protein